MSDARPAPLVAEEVDLRDFSFMPLDVVRLRDSALAAKATGDDFRAAVLLWCAAWHQVPAGTLPDDDDELANLSGYGRVVAEWQKVRSGALRGWVTCADGRLHHPVVAEKANEAWRQKLAQRWRSECARIKKHNQRHGVNLQPPEFDAWIAAGCPQGQALSVPGDKETLSPGTDKPCPSPVPRETRSKGQGPDRTGTGLTDGGGARAAAPKPPKRAARAPAPDPRELLLGVPGQLVDDFMRVRADKRARTFTKTAADGFLREAKKVGLTPEQAVKLCIERSWTSIDSTWDSVQRAAKALRGGGGGDFGRVDYTAGLPAGVAP